MPAEIAPDFSIKQKTPLQESAEDEDKGDIDGE